MEAVEKKPQAEGGAEKENKNSNPSGDENEEKSTEPAKKKAKAAKSDECNEWNFYICVFVFSYC